MKPQKARLRRGFSVGSAVVVGAVVGQTSGKDVSGTLTGISSSTVVTQRVIEGLRTGETGGNLFTLTLPPESTPWTKADTRRFKALALKRAAETATPLEDEEFSRLQAKRRQCEVETSSDEILAEWKRRRFIGQIIDVLSRNVTFFKSEDQQRIRAIADAQRA